MCACLAAVGYLHAAAPAGASARSGNRRALRTLDAQPPARLRVGSQELTRCGAFSSLVYCGRLSVPLDHTEPAGPRIAIRYRWYPAASVPPGAAGGTVVPVEGGPGYPSIGSVSEGFAPMYGPLLERWNMLVVDNRGTGSSTPLRCTALQGFTGPTASEAFQLAAGACAEALNTRWRYSDGTRVHASDMFTTAPAAEDLAELIHALGLGRVDLYGDSYGSFFAQVFAARFPHLLRSLTLDSTYQPVGLDPWYRSAIASMPGAFDAVCERAPACRDAAPGSAWTRIGELAGSLRASPVSGVVPGPDGQLRKVTIDLVGLVDLVNDAAGDPQIYRELDASARALLAAGDPAPLLRLYAQRLVEDEAYFGLAPSQYSGELYLAVSCLDYPQLFEMTAAPSVREAQFAAAGAALAPATFSPFTTTEWLAQDQNTEAYSACLHWPSPVRAQPPVVGSPPLLASSLPVLVLGGELDSWTPPVDIPKVLTDLGGHARFVELANATHVVGEGDTICGSELVRAFVARPQTLDTLEAGCAAAVPSIHAVGAYALRLGEQAPLEATAGNAAPPAALSLAAVAIETAGDAVDRLQATGLSADRGLHGGTVTATHGGSVITLVGDRLVGDVAVSGHLTLAPSPIATDGQTVTAVLEARTPALASGSFTATWTTSGSGALARITGTVGTQRLEGRQAAP